MVLFQPSLPMFGVSHTNGIPIPRVSFVPTALLMERYMTPMFVSILAPTTWFVGCKWQPPTSYFVWVFTILFVSLYFSIIFNVVIAMRIWCAYGWSYPKSIYQWKSHRHFLLIIIIIIEWFPQLYFLNLVLVGMCIFCHDHFWNTFLHNCLQVSPKYYVFEAQHPLVAYNNNLL